MVRRNTAALELDQAEACIFDCGSDIFCAAFVVDGELFTSHDAVLRVVHEFEPESGGCGMIAAALGQHGKIASRAGSEFVGKAEVERLRTRNVGAIGIAPPLEETREPEEIEAVDSFAVGVL